MSKKEKRFVMLTGIFALMFGIVPNVSAMHVMDGYLPGNYCIAWGILCLPFLVAGFISIKKKLEKRRSLIALLAMVAAYVFVISSIDLPAVAGSSSHMTGTGLGAILFGPSVMSVIGLVVLLLQALLMGHGGITTLGVNTFSMAIACPLVTWGLYRLFLKRKMNKKIAITLSTALGSLSVYVIVASQLAMAHPEGVGFGAAFASIMLAFSVFQIPLAVMEGVITAAVVTGLEKFVQPELRAVGYLK